MSLLRDENILRQSRAVVTFIDGGRELKEGASVTTTAQAMFSRPGQVINNVSHTTGKIASFEPNFWRLDGSFMLAVPPPHSTMEIGFASSQMSNIRGDFNTPPEITVNFPAQRNFSCIALVFDHTTGEAAESVRFRAFNAAGAVVMDEVVSGNGAGFMNSTRGANSVRRVVISILRTVNPLRRARVAEIHFGRVFQYDGEDIAELNTVHEADPLGKSIPQNRMRLKIFNKGRFSLLHGASHARHLRERQIVEHTQGIFDDMGTRWVHCGNYQLGGWQVKGSHVTFAAHGRSEGLGDGIYQDSSFDMFTLGQMARHVAAQAGLSVVVPASMDWSPSMPRFFGNVSHRAALSVIADLASCLLFEDGDGRIRFVDIVNEPGVFREHPDYERMFAPPKIEMGKFFNGVMLTETHLTLEPGRVQRVEMEVFGSRAVTIPFDRPIFSGGEAVVSEGFSLIGVRFHAMYMTGVLVGSGKCAIEISGDWAVFARSENFYPAPWGAHGEQHPYVARIPMFLQNMTHFNEVRSWFLARKFALLSHRVTLEADWRQNPEINCADRVNMQVEADGRRMSGHVVWQELNFKNGVLRGKTRAIARQT